MRKTSSLTPTLLIFLTLVFLPNAFAQETLSQSRVRLIYFLPKDRPARPERKAALRALILETQAVFADQMEAHGFDRKTFMLEMDKEGKPVVHHVNGKFNDAHYTKGVSDKVLNEIDERFDRSEDFYFIVIDASHHKLDGFICGYGSMNNGHGGWALMPAWGDCFNIPVATHELGHTFGLHHDLRVDDKHIVPPGHPPNHTTTFCAAEWFDVHRAFNLSQTSVNQNSTIEMLPPTFASSPNVIRLRFKVADPDGIHHVHLNQSEPSDMWLIGCNPVDGENSSIVEFVTNRLSPKTDSVRLHIMDVHGNIERSQSYPIDIISLLPRAKVVSIPDAGLAAAIRREIGNSITTHTILNLNHVFAQDEVITDLTGLEHAHELQILSLGANNRVSDFSVLAKLTKLRSFSGSVSDVSALPRVPNLISLSITGSSVSDVSTLSKFPKLIWLYLENNNISDVSVLSELTQLNWLNLRGNNVSDVSVLSGLTRLTELDVRGNPLSYASIHTHIPALQARGVEVKFNKRTHPALVKVSGDGQVDEVRTTLVNPFVVEAVNGQGKPMKGVRVAFTVPAGGGTLSATTATTDAKGRVRTTLKLGSTPGMNTVTVTAKGIRSSVTFTANATGPPIYWIDTAAGTLHRLIGNEVENLVPSVQKATSLAIDMTRGKLYWTEKTGNTTGKIQRANLDGSNTQLVKDLTSVPLDIALDTVGGKLYLTNSWGKIQRLNFDGSNFQSNLITDLQNPNHLVLDAARGKVYWTERIGKATGRLRRANLNGTNIQLVKKLTSAPHGIAIDTVNQKLYLTNSWGKIQRLNFDGSNFQSNLITDLESPKGIAVDGVNRKLYWTENGGIRCANLNGENIQNVVTGLRTPTSIVLSTPTVEVPIPAAPAAVVIVPDETNLHPNYPNPFNPETWIPYQLSKPAEVTLHIYAVNGTLIRTLALGHQPAGMYQSRARAAYWDGRNALGEPVASGLYFYTFTAGDFTATRRMLILK